MTDDMIIEADESGETRVIAYPRPSAAAVAALPRFQSRSRAWAANPHCIECGERISDPRDAGALYDVTTPLRLAHKRRPGARGASCYAAALVRLDPRFNGSEFRGQLEPVQSIIPRAAIRLVKESNRV